MTIAQMFREAYRREHARQERKDSAMAKVLKIRSKGSVPATAKAAQPGSERTGAKVKKVKAGKGQPGSAAGRYTGRTSGLSVTKFQNQSIETNRKRKLTDEALAQEWKREFPNAKADYTADTVRGVRNLYNLGKHGNDKPSTPVPAYDDSGTALPFWGSKAAEREANAGAKRSAKSESGGKKKVLKKKVKR
jgi:hypothetical protein